MAKEVDGKYTLNEWHFVLVASERQPPKLYFFMPLEYNKAKSYLKSAIYSIDAEDSWESTINDKEDLEEQLEATSLALPETLFDSWIMEAAEEFQETKVSHRYGPALVRFVFNILTAS